MTTEIYGWNRENVNSDLLQVAYANSGQRTDTLDLLSDYVISIDDRTHQLIPRTYVQIVNSLDSIISSTMIRVPRGEQVSEKSLELPNGDERLIRVKNDAEISFIRRLFNTIL